MAYFDEVMVFLLGASIGSFLTVCIHRLPQEESVVCRPSHCPQCGNKLGVPDLLPIVSYFWLRGRCRHCGSKISIQYPLVELLTAALFLADYITWGVSWHTLSMWVFLSVLVSVSVVDIQHRIIPDEILLAGAVLGLPLVFLTSLDQLISGLIGSCAAYLLMVIIGIASRGGMGGGDIKFSAVMGLFLGWQGVTAALFLSFFIGGMASILLLVTRIKGRKDAIPFGPYLALGGAMASFYAGPIIKWYLGLSGY